MASKVVNVAVTKASVWYDHFCNLSSYVNYAVMFHSDECYFGFQAAEDMYEAVANEVFLSDLKEMRDNMLSIQGDKKGMQDMIDKTTQYLDSIKSSKDLKKVNILFNDLYHALGALPFVYNCLNDKTWFIG